MRLFNIIALSTAAVLGLASCGMEDDNNSGSQKMGALEVGVAVKQPASQTVTRAGVSTSDFPVSIVGKEGTATEGITKEYATVSEVPAEIPLAVGFYIASSHTPGEMAKKMTVPYYAGSVDLEVTEGVTTQRTVTCKMQNSRIQMNYSAEFLATFSAWTITVDDGSDTVLAYDQTDTNPAAIYWAFGDNVASVTVNFRGITAKETVSDSRTFTKSQAAEHYDDDSEYFTGGEALIINMNPAVSTSGEVTGIDVKLNIIFEDHTDEVEIPVIWDKPITISEPNGTSYLANGVSFATDGTAPANVALAMKVLAGIQNLYLQIESDNTAFAGVAGGMGLVAGNGLDLASAEANTVLGSILSLPTVGATEYTLTLTSLLNMLKAYTGVHKFNLKVVDAKSNESSVTLTVTVTEEGTAVPITITEPNGNSYLTNGVNITGGGTETPVYPSNVVINMDITNGVKNLYVLVSTTSAEFSFAAGLMGLTSGDGLDLSSSAASELSSLFALPKVGDTTYSFSLNETLMKLLAGYVGKHDFILKVVDANDNVKTAILPVTVTE